MASAGGVHRAGLSPCPPPGLIARLHQVAADPAALRHQLGKAVSEPVGVDDLLLAAKHLGLKAKRTTSTVDRLSLVPLPALALLADGRCVVLAQCDGQRVLIQDASSSGSRPIIEPLVLTVRACTARHLSPCGWSVAQQVTRRPLRGR